MPRSWFPLAAFAALASGTLGAGGFLACGAGQPERICVTPDCLVVDSANSPAGEVKSIGILDTRLHLYIYVPRDVATFGLEVFDQTEDVPGARPSDFTLYSPDGTPRQKLDKPVARDWSRYQIQTAGQWGIWRLTVTGPSDNKAAGREAKALNRFMVRTRGPVDLYLKPEPVARVRGLELSEPAFGGDVHRFWIRPSSGGLRFELWRPLEAGVSVLKLDQADAQEARSHLTDDDRLPAGTTLETIRFADSGKSNLLPLRVENVRGVYRLGSESGLRLFCNPQPLMPALSRVSLRTVDEAGHGVAARLALTSPQTTNEPCVLHTGFSGETTAELLPGANYTVNASRGAEFTPVTVALDDVHREKIVLRRRWPRLAGWYAGDDHSHSLYYDGTQTPGQVMAAGQAAGLDWMCLSEHAHGPALERTKTASGEALTAAVPGRFAVIPGMEFTTPNFHANLLGGILPLAKNASLAEAVDAVQAADSEENPLVLKLNHPTLGKTSRTLAADTPKLGLIELWNSSEPAATNLWWDCLNTGRHLWADTATDSHHADNLEPGTRRTYVYVGRQPLTAANVVRALRSGHSFLSRGGVVDFRLDGHRPGDLISLSNKATVPLELESWTSAPGSTLELVGNGQVLRRWSPRDGTHFQTEETLAVQPGWYLARVLPPGSEEPLVMTNPIWVEPNKNANP